MPLPRCRAVDKAQRYPPLHRLCQQPRLLVSAATCLNSAPSATSLRVDGPNDLLTELRSRVISTGMISRGLTSSVAPCRVRPSHHSTSELQILCASTPTLSPIRDALASHTGADATISRKFAALGGCGIFATRRACARRTWLR